MKEQLKSMEASLMSIAQAQMGNLDCVDAKELGEVVDMLKDIKEALYYCEIVESMEEAKKDEEVLAKLGVDTNRYYNDNRYARYIPNGNIRGYNTHYPEIYDPNNDFYRNKNKMYYGERVNSSPSMTSSMNSGVESNYDRTRRYYTEGKLSHNGNSNEDRATNMTNLKEHLKSIGDDVIALIEPMDNNEKATVKSELLNLANKIL